MPNWGQCSLACPMYTLPTDYTGTTPATLHFAFMAGLMRQLLPPWLGTGKASQSGLSCSEALMGASRHMRRASACKSTGTTSPRLFLHGHQLAKLPLPSTSKVRIGLHSFITPVHSTMVTAGRRWISRGND